jgi:hypothetical protein
MSVDRTMVPPNSVLQRSVIDKVLGRGRVRTALLRAPSARVLTRTRAAAELDSYAALLHMAGR